jgi:hypothetical protein
MSRQFIIYSQTRDHDQDYFHELSEICMRNGKLIVQEYTGKFLNDLFLQTYYSFSPEDRSVFRRRVIFDMTCGDASCMTDMSKTFPMIDMHGDFLNFMLIPPEDLQSYVNKNEKLDELIQSYYKKEYKKILNEEHTNYRRRMNGDTCLFLKPEYDKYADPQDIFDVIKKKLNKATEPLKHFNFPKEKYEELILNYRNYDMYKWYTLMNNL